MSVHINKYNSPTITHWELDNKGNKTSIQVKNETHTVVGGKVVLQGLPDDMYRVYIDNMVEIDINDKITTARQFKVDYRHTGTIFFHEDVEGSKILVNSYYSKGVVYYPAERVWTKVDDFGQVVETLDGVVEKIEYVKDNIERLDNLVDESNEISDKLDESIDTANRSKDELEAVVGDSVEKKQQLDDSITKSEVSKGKLDDTIAKSETSNKTLTATIEKGEKTNQTLILTTDEAEKVVAELVEQITKGETVDNELAKTIAKAISQNTELINTMADSVVKKDELADMIAKAISENKSLGLTKEEAIAVKEDLQSIIDGTDFEQVIEDIQNLQRDKVSKTGDTMTGELKVNANVLGSESTLSGGGLGIDLHSPAGMWSRNLLDFGVSGNRQVRVGVFGNDSKYEYLYIGDSYSNNALKVDSEHKVSFSKDIDVEGREVMSEIDKKADKSYVDEQIENIDLGDGQLVWEDGKVYFTIP